MKKTGPVFGKVSGKLGRKVGSVLGKFLGPLHTILRSRLSYTTPRSHGSPRLPSPYKDMSWQRSQFWPSPPVTSQDTAWQRSRSRPTPPVSGRGPDVGLHLQYRTKVFGFHVRAGFGWTSRSSPPQLPNALPGCHFSCKTRARTQMHHVGIRCSG